MGVPSNVNFWKMTDMSLKQNSIPIPQLPSPFIDGVSQRMNGLSRKRGSKEFSWRPLEVSKEDLEKYGKEYWEDFLDNCLCIGLVGRKMIHPQTVTH